MEKIFTIFLFMFISGALLIILSLNSGRFKHATETLVKRAISGFIKGFVMSFIVISIMVALMMSNDNFKRGTTFDFILWNTLVSIFVALFNSIVMAVGVDMNKLNSIMALGVVSTVFSGFVTIAFIVIYVFR